MVNTPVDGNCFARRVLGAGVISLGFVGVTAHQSDCPVLSLGPYFHHQVDVQRIACLAENLLVVEVIAVEERYPGWRNGPKILRSKVRSVHKWTLAPELRPGQTVRTALPDDEACEWLEEEPVALLVAGGVHDDTIEVRACRAGISFGREGDRVLHVWDVEQDDWRDLSLSEFASELERLAAIDERCPQACNAFKSVKAPVEAEGG